MNTSREKRLRNSDYGLKNLTSRFLTPQLRTFEAFIIYKYTICLFAEQRCLTFPPLSFTVYYFSNNNFSRQLPLAHQSQTFLFSRQQFIVLARFRFSFHHRFWFAFSFGTVIFFVGTVAGVLKTVLSFISIYNRFAENSNVNKEKMTVRGRMLEK